MELFVPGLCHWGGTALSRVLRALSCSDPQPGCSVRFFCSSRFVPGVNPCPAPAASAAGGAAWNSRGRVRGNNSKHPWSAIKAELSISARQVSRSWAGLSRWSAICVLLPGTGARRAPRGVTLCRPRDASAGTINKSPWPGRLRAGTRSAQGDLGCGGSVRVGVGDTVWPLIPSKSCQAFPADWVTQEQNVTGKELFEPGYNTKCTHTDGCSAFEGSQASL